MCAAFTAAAAAHSLEFVSPAFELNDTLNIRDTNAQKTKKCNECVSAVFLTACCSFAAGTQHAAWLGSLDDGYA